jgi:hypothetical protein
MKRTYEEAPLAVNGDKWEGEETGILKKQKINRLLDFDAENLDIEAIPDLAKAQEIIVALVKQNQQLKEEVGRNVPAQQLGKDKIYDYMQKIAAVTLSGKVMSNIFVSDDEKIIKSLGRAEVEGSSTKQMRHTIPYLFMKKYLGHVIDTSSSFTDVLNKLSKSLSWLIQSLDGYGFYSSDLNVSPMKYKKALIEKIATKKMVLPKGECLLVDGNKHTNTIFGPEFSPSKPTKARKDYSELNKKFVEKAIQVLNESIPEFDKNTKNICAEALSEMLLTLYNKGKGCAFPEEGNTAPYEIRLYENKKQAKAAQDDYTVISVKELQELDLEKLDSCIRLVNNEGDRVKKAIATLEYLDQMIAKFNLGKKISKQIKEYNSGYNIKINLGKGKNVTSYNADLSKKNIEELSPYHIAKVLYGVFDFKPLEQSVLAPTKEAKEDDPRLNLYSSATGKVKVPYSITDGKAYRANMISKAKGYNQKVKFRGEEIDQDFLAGKAVEMVGLAIKTFDNLNHGFVESSSEKGILPKKILSAFTELLTMDYEIDTKIFEDFVMPYSSVKSSFGAVEPDSSDVAVKLFLKGQDGFLSVADLLQ